MRLAGIENFHWHDLRHSFASRLVMAGVDLRTVQELLGHKTIAMTVRYSHLAPTHLQEAVERLTAKPTDTTTDTRQSAATAGGSLRSGLTRKECWCWRRELNPHGLLGHEILSLARLPVPPLQRTA